MSTSRRLARPSPTPPAPPLAHDPRAFLRRLRRRTVAAAVVGFGAFFGLATVNVVGVTARTGTTDGTARPAAASPAPTLATGDFFGQPGAAITTGGTSGQVAPVNVVPPLSGGSGGAMLSSGGS